MIATQSTLLLMPYRHWYNSWRSQTHSLGRPPPPSRMRHLHTEKRPAIAGLRPPLPPPGLLTASATAMAFGEFSHRLCHCRMVFMFSALALRLLSPSPMQTRMHHCIHMVSVGLVPSPWTSGARDMLGSPAHWASTVADVCGPCRCLLWVAMMSAHCKCESAHRAQQEPAPARS